MPGAFTQIGLYRFSKSCEPWSWKGLPMYTIGKWHDLTVGCICLCRARRGIDYSISIPLFNEVIRDSDLAKCTPLDIDDATVGYDSFLRQIVTRHSPGKSKCVVIRPVYEWYA